MMKFLLSMGLFFLTTSTTRAASDSIWWSNGRLKWSDFKANADTASYNKDHFATTLWKLTYYHRFTKRTGQVEVIAYAWFDGRHSWVRSSQRTNAALLRHEQGHFDLAEILARQFKQKIAQTGFKPDTYANLLNQLFAELLADLNDKQLQYDIDTRYGEKPDEQRRWDTNIATTLSALRAFADRRVLSKE